MTNKSKKTPPSKSNKFSSKRGPLFTIAYTNIRGLRSNWPAVEEFARTNPSLLALSETGLDHSIPEQEFSLPGYSPLISKPDHLLRHGHGLGVYIREGFPCGRDISYEVPNSPFMCFRVALLHSTAFIFTLYRPQDDGCSVIDHIADQIDKIYSDYPSANIHVCGDFNVHHEEWLVHSNKTDPEGRICYDFSIAYELTQIVDKPTRIPDNINHSPNLLDLFLTSCPDLCTATVMSPLGRSDHCMVSVKVDIQCKESSDVPFQRTVFRYSKADWDGFRSFMADAPLDAIFNSDSSEAATSVSDWILAGMEIFIPSKKYQQKSNSQPWFTPGCAAAIAHRNHFFHLYHQNVCDETKAAFKTARNRCHQVLRDAKSNYAESVQARIKQQRLGSREFWRITNRVLNRGKPPIPTIINGPEVLSSSFDKASLFASNFAKNSTLDDTGHQLPDFPSRTESSLNTFRVSVKSVANQIKNLQSGKATGPDNIPVVVIKHISPELSPILAKLFNRCLEEGCFPASWKFSTVCPVYKNAGDRQAPSQYRPISLLSIISKLFESIINEQIMLHLSKGNLLCDFQYGFRASRSTADVLTVITHRISGALDRTFDARAIALDISKAFDKVWHKGLLHKIASYGITGRVFSVIQSFLTGRTMKVVVNGQSSGIHDINAGVPQGSVLGPTLFLLFINDLPDNILRSFVNIYADDTTLYGCTSKDLDHVSLASNLSSDLSNIVDWGKKWLVAFNSAKTKLLSIHHHKQVPTLPPIMMDNSVLTDAPFFDKLLGLKITPDLKWDSYLDNVKKEVAKMVGSLSRSRKFLTPPAILYLYKSQIRPRMEYCSHIWAGSSKQSLSGLDRIQERLRGLVGEELFSTLSPLSHRRNVASLSLFYRYFHGRCSDELHLAIPSERSFQVRTRFAVSCKSHPSYLTVPRTRCKFHADSFIPRVTELWNELPQECFPDGYNLKTFKSRVNRHLSQLHS